MSQDKFVVTSGIKHFPVFTDDGRDTGRSVDFNPADQGFAEDLYCLVSKLSAIHEAKTREYEAEQNPAARFDINRAANAEMQEAVDAMFGEGFSRDVFKTRLFALADGMTVVENFLFALLDKMDESITQNMAKRDDCIRKYTAKYNKYTKKN